MFRAMAEAHPEKFAVRVGYDNGMPHRIEAAADMFLMPSQYEPCGLNQMYSLRYGTVPIVRTTGGLADTIDETTGFKFSEYTPEALLAAIDEASLPGKTVINGSSACAAAWRKIFRGTSPPPPISASTAASSRHRIKPAQPRKPREVGVGRRQFAPVLNRQRRQMSIGSQVSRGPHLFDQPKENLRVIFPGRQDLNAGDSQPTSHTHDSVARIQRNLAKILGWVMRIKPRIMTHGNPTGRGSVSVSSHHARRRLVMKEAALYA